MFTDNTTLGVILAIIFIGMTTWFVVHNTKSLIAQDKILFLLIYLVSMLTSVWTVDRVVAFKISLLTPEESKSIFEIIRTIVTLVLGYYFGTKNQSTEK